MEAQREREVLTEFIETYRDLPCLWDSTQDSYKDTDQKKDGWEHLLAILKQIEPAANVTSVKKKMENLKSCYYRELKKVKQSKREAGSSGGDVHKPYLWYFELFSFLNKRNKPKDKVELPLSDDEDKPLARKRKRKRMTVEEGESHLESKEKPDPNPTPKKEHKSVTNTFGIYVGEKLKQIPSGQRDIAEKLISDVLFFAITNKLDVNSCIETPYTNYNTGRHPRRYSPLPHLSHSEFNSEVSETSRSSHFTSAPSSSLTPPVQIQSSLPFHTHHNSHQVPTSSQIVQSSSQYLNTPDALNINKEESESVTGNNFNEVFIKHENINW
ncbi:unnamed protein product [Chrysodeixis includens]|uniref:MADF domain-containing protein n=1 Tax=Chrysodeixis includens TaxID=689277 RepID=A0A9N8Q0I7_CHRIL|nr:unnamed protein product [Chrysodeixis includens]